MAQRFSATGLRGAVSCPDTDIGAVRRPHSSHSRRLQSNNIRMKMPLSNERLSMKTTGKDGSRLSTQAILMADQKWEMLIRFCISLLNSAALFGSLPL
jgi:hypothetical protein